MKLIQFGQTKLKVTKIGLGLAALGRPGYINLGHEDDLKNRYEVSEMERITHEVLDIAYQNRIRYFDAARSYGRAEAFYASWKGANNDLVIGSKWGYTYTAGWKVNAQQHEVKEHSIDVLNRQWIETLNSLSRFPDIYHIHSASDESKVLKNSAVIERLWELKEQGVIIGLSLSGPHQGETLEKSLEIKSDKTQLFQSVQVTWNMLERSTSLLLEKASNAGYGVIVKEALANGRLTNRNKSRLFIDKMRVLSSIAERHHVNEDALAIAYILRQPWVSVVLSGASVGAHLVSNLDALQIKLNDSEMRLMNQLVEPPEDYWATRSEMAWN